MNYPVGSRITGKYGWHIVFTGTADEHDLVAGIQGKMGAHAFSLVNCLDLQELSDLSAMNALLIANNSGPAHIAVAVGAPVVSLYALTNPQHTSWTVPNRVLNHDVG